MESRVSSTSVSRALAIILAWVAVTSCGGGEAPAGGGSVVAVRVTPSGIEMPGELASGNLTFEVSNESEKICYFGLTGGQLTASFGIEGKVGRDVAPGETATWSRELQGGEYRVDCADESFEGAKYLEVDEIVLTVF